MSEGPTIGGWTQYGWIPDGASSFPARVRLRNAAWMVYYEPDIVVQQERDEMLELQAENAKLREFATETWELLTCNEPVFVWKELQELARKLEIEVEE